MSLVEYVLVCMLTLIPGRYHAPLAIGIADAVQSRPALFKGDEEPSEVIIDDVRVTLPAKSKTAALMVAIAFREGGLRPGVVGDCPHMKPGDPHCTIKEGATSFGTFQRNLPFKSKSTLEQLTGEELLANPGAQAREAFATLAISIRVCPESPVAWYAHGREPREACADKHARSISVDRMWLAKKVRTDAARAIIH